MQPPPPAELTARIRELPAARPLIERLGEDPTVYLVGGAVRDMLLGGKPFDLDLMRFTSPFNLAGTPTISLPAGVDAAGLPLGIQLAGPWLTEPALIRAGVAFQNETDFHERHPDLDAVAAV